MSTGCLTIDLTAIKNNWQLLNKKLDTTACGAVIKANAYGLGAIPVARVLVDAGCKTFFIATIDEAVEIREQVVGDYQLIVLGGMASSYHAECIHYNIVPVLITNEQLSLWAQSCRSSAHPWPSIIKVDTGMHRFGLSPDDIYRQLDDLQLLKQCSPMMVMSHLACADDPGATLNTRQLTCFTAVTDKVRERLPTIKASLVNSSGIFLGPQYFFDMARPGIALYGGNPTPYQANPMQSVVSLHLPINQIRVIHDGESVGYGGEFIASGDRKIATVFGGYADGLPRCLSGRGYGYYRGHRVPIVGRISMDAIAFDISSVSDDDVFPQANEIEVLGQHHTIDQLASEAGTISYELLTQLGSRFRREYI